MDAHKVDESTLAPVAGEDEKLIERIHALSDCAYWATCGWDIPGDGIQKIGRLALKAAARLAAHAREIAELRAERDRAVEVADAQTKGVYSKYMLEAADAIADIRYLRLLGDGAEGELARMMEKVDKAEARAESAEADCARLRQDAERLQWLVDNWTPQIIPLTWNYKAARELDSSNLRAYIDAAIAEGKHD
jgi:hypothetical protein